MNPSENEDLTLLNIYSKEDRRQTLAESDDTCKTTLHLNIKVSYKQVHTALNSTKQLK